MKNIIWIQKWTIAMKRTICKYTKHIYWKHNHFTSSSTLLNSVIDIQLWSWINFKIEALLFGIWNCDSNFQKFENSTLLWTILFSTPRKVHFNELFMFSIFNQIYERYWYTLILLYIVYTVYIIIKIIK